MAELNESQLILLNSLVYVDADYSSGTSMADLVNGLLEPGMLDNMTYGGGMTRDEVEDMLKEIAKDPALMALTIDSSVDTEIRGVCFVDPAGEAVIAFRGTGPAYAAWDDNCQGGYLSDTDMQEEALAFAQDCAKRYDDITVTGHSKGGNMAQYVTVLMGDEVDRCVSFDGQGFGDEFLKKYEDEIAANRSKIRNVCAYNDYVNILLTPIAGEIVYLDNEETGKGGHYIYDLYTNKNNKLDKNGEYVTSRKQDPLMSGAKAILDVLVKALDRYSLEAPVAEFIIYSLAGILMGALVADEDVDLKKILVELLKNLEDFLEQLSGVDLQNWLTGRQDPGASVSVSVSVDTAALRDYGSVLSTAADEIDTLRSKIKALQKKMSTNIIDSIAIGLPLQTVIMQLDNERSKLDKLAAALNNCADQYDSAESLAKESAG